MTKRFTRFAKSGDTRPPYNLRAKQIDYRIKESRVNNGVKLALATGLNKHKPFIYKYL